MNKTRKTETLALRIERFFMYFQAALWLNQPMAEFPDIVEASLRTRFVSLGVRPEEVDERFIRGSGAGGQKINKTSSTVCLKHRPTGVEVRCQRERSQTLNRLLAWTELAEKLEWRRQGAANRAQAARELIRRQKRGKSRGQKIRMIQSKKHRAKIKSNRGRGIED
jgi:peptide chain release factor